MFDNIAADVVAHSGGTYAPTGEPVAPEGYAVAGIAPALRVPVERFGGDVVRATFDRFAHCGERIAVGFWVDENGTVWAEPSNVFPDRTTAIREGQRRREIAIYDLAHNETIYLNDNALAA